MDLVPGAGCWYTARHQCMPSGFAYAGDILENAGLLERAGYDDDRAGGLAVVMQLNGSADISRRSFRTPRANRVGRPRAWEMEPPQDAVERRSSAGSPSAVDKDGLAGDERRCC